MKRTHARRYLFISLLMLASVSLLLAVRAPAGATGTIYVDTNSGCNSACGASWETAHPNLQDALLAAANGDQIWVSEGVYYPDEGSGQADGDRSASFALLDGVAIYGGFAGDEGSLDQRDVVGNPTVLSGDIDQDDTVDANGVVTDTANISGANVYHVVNGSGVDDTASLDGFTITAGQANGTTPDNSGGGMLIAGGHPSLRELTFSGNSASTYGGGLHNDDGASPTITSALFINNSSTLGGGLYSLSSASSLTDVDFVGNLATNFGGGLGSANSDLSLTNVTFASNRANGSGGGMYAHSSTQIEATMVVFNANSAGVLGAGVYNTSNAQVALSQAEFSANSANYGAGLATNGASVTLTQAVLDGNTAVATQAGGMYNSSADVSLSQVVFSNNYAKTDGGAMFNTNSSPVLTRVTFSGNSADSDGGAVYNQISSSPSFTNVTFSGNAAAAFGGGLYHASGSPSILNSTFSDNSAGSVGALYIAGGSPLLNNVIVANSIGGDCVLGASGSLAAGSSHNLIEDTGSDACDLSDGIDNNIIGEDPNLGSLQDNGGAMNTHALLTGSPAIDAGDDAGCPATDQRGVARPQPAGGQCDLGAVEYDDTNPQVDEISLLDSNPTRSENVAFLVTFTEAVVNVDAADFALTNEGTLTGTQITDVSGSGLTYSVTVATGSQGGLLRLDLPGSATIVDLANNSITGLPYTDGSAYAVLGIKLYLPATIR
ncbi:MAG: choice-of-anchor Q domain-containing protein [Candidatus Promineifilaceae bacterium]|nr:choice-of-anchor Q domain-containing protein [Candidatus Promineifilaceae bacterium]